MLSGIFKIILNDFLIIFVLTSKLFNLKKSSSVELNFNTTDAVKVKITVLLCIYNIFIIGGTSFGNDFPMQSSGVYKKSSRGGYRDRERDRDDYSVGNQGIPKDPSPSKSQNLKSYIIALICMYIR